MPNTPPENLLELETQAMFEDLWFHVDPREAPLLGTRPSDRGWIVYHTAKWCGPCKRMDIAAIAAAAAERGLTVWRVDQDVNDYTTGYCGVRSIPTFQMCVPKKIVSTFQPASTESVLEWMKSL
jgi:thioredoxin-like negative regulator of GroEL